MLEKGTAPSYAPPIMDLCSVDRGMATFLKGQCECLVSPLLGQFEGKNREVCESGMSREMGVTFVVHVHAG